MVIRQNANLISMVSRVISRMQVTSSIGDFVFMFIMKKQDIFQIQQIYEANISYVRLIRKPIWVDK